jgi:uncharacterized protein YjbI with pentapeptide repeats
MSTTKAWYIRSFPELAIKGPFPAGQISQEILLGRYKPVDEVSHDKEIWLKISDVPELLPEIMNKDSDIPEFEDRLAAARRWADERRDVGGKKRGASKIDDVKRIHNLVDNANKSSSRLMVFLQMGTVLGLVAVVVALAFQYSPKNKIEVDCSKPAQQAVDWSECELVSAQLAQAELVAANLMNTNLQQANLTGANLSQANLKYTMLNSANLRQVNFSQANLIGANMLGADLTGAVFTDADLSYANFRGAVIVDASFSGARLNSAIWVDGRICAKDSIGRCN